MAKAKYIRDNRSPTPKNENVSKVMSANKAKNTKPEILFRKSLWASGSRGYRSNYKKAPGSPDIAFPVKKIAIFVHGCFWHRCPKCNYPLPKNNIEFWKNKFEKNKARDIKKIKDLKKAGWKVLVFWECDLKKNMNRSVKKVEEEIKNSKAPSAIFDKRPKK
jgi:DNA mismatch endonuclease, patch repair protein